MTTRGGNTDTIYNTGDKRLEFAMSLTKQHPDVAGVTFKYGRYHHYVDYRKFKKNKLQRINPDISIPNRVNEFDMKLIFKPEAEND